MKSQKRLWPLRMHHFNYSDEMWRRKDLIRATALDGGRQKLRPIHEWFMKERASWLKVVEDAKESTLVGSVSIRHSEQVNILRDIWVSFGLLDV